MQATLPDLMDTIKRFASVQERYPVFVDCIVRTCAETYDLASDKEAEQSFIDAALNACPFLNMPEIYVVLEAVQHPIVIPEHLTVWGKGTEQVKGWNWQQVLYGIARATIEADIRQRLKDFRENRY